MNEFYNLFSIPILRIPTTDVDFYHKIQNEIKNAIQIIYSTNDFSNTSFYANKKSGVKDYIFLEKYNCSNLEKKIKTGVKSYIDELKLTYNGEFIISNSWLNIHHTDDNHPKHNHPGHTISGVYYFRVNEEQGGICFTNPNTIITFGQFPQGYASPMTTTIIPDDGDLILFPSWLEHATVKNSSVEDRISVAFNIDYNFTKTQIGLLKNGFIPYHNVIRSFRINENRIFKNDS